MAETLLTTTGGEGGAPAAGNQSVGGSPGGAQAASGAGTALGGGASSAAGTQAPAAGGSAQSWRESLSQDLRTDASLLPFENVDALAKSYIYTKSLMGKKGVFPPGEKASEEEWSKFYDTLGRPPLDKYEIKAPEGTALDEGLVNGFKEQMYKAGVKPQDAQKTLEWFTQAEAAQDQALEQAVQAETAVQLGQLRAEWGEGFQKNVGLAQLAVNELGGPDMAQYLNDTGLGNDVRLIKFMANVGKLLGEDKLRGDGTGPLGQTPEEIDNELAKLWAHPAMADRRHREHDQIVKQMSDLTMKKAKYPTQRTG